MADNLIFPIGFDLESGVKDAIKKGDAALRQIEAAMNRKPIVLRAEVDANKFQMFSRQFSNSIDGISAKLAQAQRIWNSMSFDVKFDSDGNLSRRAQIVFDAFQQLTQASATMGQRLGEVNRNLAKSEADTARAITAEYNKRQQLINEQIRLKERQAAAEERVRQSQLKGVNVGYVDTQKQVEAVRNLRLQYEAILPMLNAMAQRRYDIKVGIDKQFEADIQRINAEIARLRQSNLQLGAKGDTNAIQANLQAIRRLEAELQRISQQKIDLLNSNKINSDLARLRTEISSVFGELQNAERKLAADNSLNTALDTQSQKVLKLHADIQKLDQQIAQLNAQGKMYNADGSFSTQAISILQQRIALTKQLEQEAITGQQAQIRLEQQLREEKRKTEQEAKNAAKEAERQAKAEAAARKQAQDAANAENKARQEAYNARRRQGQETQRILNKEAKSIADITAKLQIQQQRLQSANIGSAKFNKIAEEVRRLTQELDKANKKMRELTGQTQSSAATQSAAVRQVSQEFQTQDGYVSRLLKRMAVYAGYSYVSNFLTSVREVTAQFELQRISLGAIIQDQQKANQLFGEIKSFALKSPLKILDLTKYTKQVAAYRIETDKLFDTTKRLADVSVGLGVDMGRLVLAYGQVKAASYLRAAEIRQFTEAGIPLLELLAEKFTELQGTAVSTEEVMDKVSRRMVSFSMVEEIFKDMTDAGGMFYNMQEKQSQTLYGMWAKMGDAAAVMYDQIGNTATVNSGMKYLIQLLQDSMLHWTAFANVLQTGVLGFAAYKAAMAGLVPFYKLNSIQIMASIKAEKAQQSLLLRRTSLYTKLTTAQLRQLVSTKKLTTAEWEEYITKNKLNQISALRLARMSKENAALQKALISQKLYTQAQLQQIQAMSKGQYVWATVKSAVMGVGGAIKSVGAMLKTFWPLAAITAVIDLLMDWRQAVEAQEAAAKKVDKQYEEMKVTLMEIENAYNDIKNASKSATENEEEFAKTSYSQKLEQLKNIMKLLSQFGLKNTIDLSVLNYENIDPVIDNWIKKLNEVNELSQKWGRSVAEVANAYEGNIFGWSIFGENLNEDMKDLSRSWTKLTVNTEFNNSLRQLKAIVGELANENKGVYDQISKAVGMDLKLALAQKRRNESEVQYQQRIYKNYQNIESYLQTFRNKGEYGGMLPSLSAADVADRFGDFKSDLDEVMHEVRKTIAAFENEEPMTIRMAIDQQFTLNEWEEWQKELVIQELNKDRLKAGLDLVPTLSSAATGAVAEGLKAIITSEFPGLFKDEELQSLVSAEGIVEAIKTKLDASNESLEKSVQLQNNLAYGSKGFENSLDRVKKLQQEITDIENMRAELAELDTRNGNLNSDELLRRSELQAKLQEVDEASLNTKRAQIAAIVEANAKYDEQIQKQRESAETEREIAKAALERVSSMGLSDLGKDVKEQFGGLMVDAVKEMTDKNYSTDFLISDEDLKKVRDVGDLYAQWAQNTKAIKDEKEKLVGVGITEATIERERAALEEKRAKIELQLKAIETEISAEKFKGQEAQYATLKLALANATTTDAQKTAQENLNKFLGDTKNAEFAILMLKREGLKTSLQEALVSEAANNQIDAYLKGLDNAEKLWEELGKRYNFRLQETGGNHGGSGEDPWIILMKNRMKFMQDFQKGVEDLSKWMGYTKGLADEQENMLGRGLSLKIDSRKLNGTKDELIAWYEDAIGEVRKRIAKLGGKEWEGLGVQMILAKDTKSRVLKKYQELLADMFKELTDFRTEQMQSEMERKLKALADRISRTKTAKEFYEKILSQTGDVELAANLSVSVYGQNGGGLQKEIATQLSNALKGVTADGQTIGPDVFEVGVIDPNTLYVNYTKLREIVEKQGDKLSDSQKKILDEMLKNGEAYNKAQVEQWAKDLAKVKDYTDQYIDLYRMTEKRKAEIRQKMASGELSEDAGKQEIAGYDARLIKEQSKIQYEMFKNSPMYTSLFENMENATVQSLQNMRSQIEKMMAVTKEPTQLKELQNRLNEIDETLAEKSPFEVIAKGWQTMGEMAKKYGSRSNLDNLIKQKQAELDALQAELDAALEKETQAKQFAEMVGVDVQTPTTAITPVQKAALAAYQQASADVKEYGNAVKKADNEQQKLTSDATKWANAMGKVKKGLKTVIQIGQNLLKASEAAQEFAEALGMSEDGLELFQDINNVISNTLNFADALIGCVDLMAKTTAQSISTVEKASVILTVISAALQVATAIFNLFGNAKVRKANKEIKRQQKLLDQLEYTYGRLEKAADKAFGADFVANQKQQRKILLAQAEAYQKQYQAELSKGKKADEEKLKEFQEKYRDTMDVIADMEGQVAERMLGTDLTSAARDFANAWLEAYKEFGNTADAMSEKFHEMIQNMIVESLLAKVMERALKPAFDMIDNMNEEDFYSESFWKKVMATAEQGAKDADHGAGVVMKWIEQMGYDMREMGSEYSGIAKEVSSASSEEINQLSAFVNTALYYVSPIPTISDNVAVIRQLMERGTTSTLPDTTAAGWTDWQQQAMDNYKAIAANTAATVVECRRAANACEAATEKLNRIIVAKGGKFAVNTTYV